MPVFLIYPPLDSERQKQIHTYLNEHEISSAKDGQLKLILNRIQKEDFVALFPELRKATIDVHWYHPWHNFLDFRDYHRQLPRRLQTNEFVVLGTRQIQTKIRKLLQPT